MSLISPPPISKTLPDSYVDKGAVQSKKAPETDNDGGLLHLSGARASAQI